MHISDSRLGSAKDRRAVACREAGEEAGRDEEGRCRERRCPAGDLPFRWPGGRGPYDEEEDEDGAQGGCGGRREGPAGVVARQRTRPFQNPKCIREKAY